MSLFNDNLKEIKIYHIAILIVVSYFVLYGLGMVTDVINVKWLYVVIMVYFIIKLKEIIQYMMSLRNEEQRRVLMG